MATLYVTEFSALGDPGGNIAQLPATPKVVSNNVTIGGSTTQSAPFAGNTRIIRVHADAICSVEIGGLNPVATAASQRFAANQTEYFVVAPSDRLAVITNS